MLDFEWVSGDMDRSIQLAAWALGIATVCMAIFLVWGSIRWLGGKFAQSSNSSQKGLVTIGLSFLGTVVLASATGMVLFSASDDNYQASGSGVSGLEGLMPEAAQPGAVEIERNAPLVTCDTTEDWEAERRSTSWNGPRRPSEDGEAQAWERADEMGIRSDVEDYFDDEWDYHPNDPELSGLEWIPDGSHGACSVSNGTAEPDTTITISYVVPETVGSNLNHDGSQELTAPSETGRDSDDGSDDPCAGDPERTGEDC